MHIVDPLTAIVFTGSFTLGGVLLTSVAAGVGGLVRHRWTTTEAESQRASDDHRELRTLRRDAYAKAITQVDRSVNQTTALNSKIEAGLVTPISLQSSEADFDAFIDTHFADFEALDAAIISAAVVAGAEVSRLLFAVEAQVSADFAAAARGGISPPYTKFRRVRADCLEAMRREVTEPPGRTAGTVEH